MSLTARALAYTTHLPKILAATFLADLLLSPLYRLLPTPLPVQLTTTTLLRLHLVALPPFQLARFLIRAHLKNLSPFHLAPLPFRLHLLQLLLDAQLPLTLKKRYRFPNRVTMLIRRRGTGVGIRHLGARRAPSSPSPSKEKDDSGRDRESAKYGGDGAAGDRDGVGGFGSLGIRGVGRIGASRCACGRGRCEVVVEGVESGGWIGSRGDESKGA